MKTTILLVFTVMAVCSLTAQSWNPEIYRLSPPDKKQEKTLKIKPEAKLRITTLSSDTDSLRILRNYSGRFIEQAGDSVRLRPEEMKLTRKYDSGKIDMTLLTREYFDSDSTLPDFTSVAISDIHELRYINKPRENFASVEDGVLFFSIAALIVSPFICIDYKDGGFNEDLYQFLALGSTAGIVVGFGLQFMGGDRHLVFHPGLISKKEKVWSFETE